MTHGGILFVCTPIVLSYIIVPRLCLVPNYADTFTLSGNKCLKFKKSSQTTFSDVIEMGGKFFDAI